MLNKRFTSTALILALIWALAACGFQLRGTGTSVGIPFKSVYVTSGSAFATLLKRYIAAGGTEVTSEPKAAEAIVDILGERQDKSILSRNTQGRIREYQLHYRVRFRVRSADNAELIPAKEIVLTRHISFNESQVLAKESEEAALYQEMQNDMVQQVLRRLAAIRPGQASAAVGNS